MDIYAILPVDKHCLQVDESAKPPKPRVLPGRPKKQRIRSRNEILESRQHCSICNELGHNQRTCDSRAAPSYIAVSPVEREEGSANDSDDSDDADEDIQHPIAEDGLIIIVEYIN